ncbi:uncharacterized protein F4807DRAFT_466221 [Annulohypoxylon truncatum]|uniref:uncharacterized protein n=1 Tax=Annulohypoxylon truncatum TaxID=327061 RepID=UPI002007846A|nr:uncharacterized protein F4807DRAFT_466221 [Annulohypoxylon truncatum]KAI1214729.1 hypothetical protein F4807DRAFT_466221 [Annulohypoxylon truncatum]
MAIMKTILSFMVLATAALCKGTTPIDTWTLHNSSIICNTSCEYNLFIQKTKSGGEFNCKFSTKGPPDPYALPIDEPCHGEPHLVITLSWGVDRSIIFCIADLEERTIAYYGLEAFEISNDTIAPNKTEWAWGLGQIPILSTDLPSSPALWV